MKTSQASPQPQSEPARDENETQKAQFRCKLYALSEEAGSKGDWKERGVGHLRLNVMKSDAKIARLGR